MSLRVALGAYLLSGIPGYRQAGIHHYIRALLAHLPLVAQNMHMSAFISPTARHEVVDSSWQAPPFELISAPYSTESPYKRIWVEQWFTPIKVQHIEAQIYHSLAFALPVGLKCKKVVTIYDLSFLTQPQTHKVFNRVYLNLMTKWACQKADHIITISEFTKKDVMRHYGIDQNKITATPLGVDNHYYRRGDEEIAQFKTTKNIHTPAIFYLGSLEPRKNLITLISAFAQLHHLQPNVKLYIGGSMGWKYGDIFAQVKAYGIEQAVTFLGRIDSLELPQWYSMCDVFTYPSLYEGFGLPPLEAMACGAPVITSDATSLPEVVGDAGLMIDPTNASALARAIEKVLFDKNLQMNMREKGIARARSFTWQNTARQTVEVYKYLEKG
jgi:glycosyltransferase involved in cell wall biosynthesis